ncbi:sigma-54 dependent transcriptional regulator [Chitinimonas viridis]|uniref:Sigma-54 dependent transcriptional regulator n=1 Tax=Chitinimonas viridis TaxID=664880 RepID=A0ABT8BA48_9NEIS|nr:sigma-54 dependent transcriptional regulator [Chitinimonas viridis]MDN3579021.1 sigma-54 dependent transcriptional regulator [Chitinimonas viridis]
MQSSSRLNLVGSSPAFQHALKTIHRLAPVDATVLIGGESGTGKELAARALHYLGPRSDQPFIPVNCGALSDTLFESELFGHERGAFTDAKQSSQGLVGEAEGGTLFLDEIDTLTAKAQGALLRFLQDKSYRRVGGKGYSQANVRVLVASNADLGMLVQQQRFRQDLLYRLNVLCVTLPPLRERHGDALELAHTFITRLGHQYRSPGRKLHPDAIAFIEQYSWPGNVRELENVIHREFLMSDGDELRCEESRQRMAFATRDDVCARSFKDAKARAIAEFERRYVAELLAQAGGKITDAAKLAGKDRSAFGKLVKKYTIEADFGDFALN